MTGPLHLPLAPEDRKLTIGSTDIRYIANGEIAKLAQEKRGEIPPPNLDHVFKVQLGKHTEGFHGRWHQQHCCPKGTGIVKIEGQRQPMPERKLPSWVAASYDFWLYTGLLSHPFNPGDIVLETKHTNARNGLRDCATYYMAQLQWQMLVSDERVMRFSIIPGNDEPVWGEIEADLVMQELLLEKAEIFWKLVQSGRPVYDTEPDAAIAGAAAAVKIDGKRSYDWSKDNAWIAGEREFVMARAMQSIGKARCDNLKKLVPSDAAEVTGRDVSCKRDKRGAIRWDVSEEALIAAEKECELLLQPAPERARADA